MKDSSSSGVFVLSVIAVLVTTVSVTVVDLRSKCVVVTACKKTGSCCFLFFFSDSPYFRAIGHNRRHERVVNPELGRQIKILLTPYKIKPES